MAAPPARARPILVTGALGQIGSELVPALRSRYGNDQVIASDVRVEPFAGPTGFPSEHLDCTDISQLQDFVWRHDVGTIYHLAALLSATAE
ncbi:MAG TPA: NAD-dependent epimerase/dehydratase family protein, partial [Hyphomicrobiaceae bacterium]|nr:NAD-dependent epimerase/dehydratase family protein [Hyphomicrobiaceae bacterium]